MGKQPRIGVGVIVIRDGGVLLGKRKGSHGEGSWSFPGGHLEFGEDVEECARREVVEETGIIVKNTRLGPFTNDVFKDEGKHYVTLFVISEHNSGEPELKEPDRCERWGWFDWNQLPQPLFLPIQNLLKQGYRPFR